ncbi:MAG: hypothetical protein AVDCRST_MAG38-3018, partial [uncultured Solirubrobacteraceae bacterium]
WAHMVADGVRGCATACPLPAGAGCVRAGSPLASAPPGGTGRERS